MEIPKHIKVNGLPYQVLQPKFMDRPYVRADIHYAGQTIRVAQYCNVLNRKFIPFVRSEAFWHEVTHAILHHMGHPLESNEKFVDAFSSRLNNVIHSAKFI